MAHVISLAEQARFPSGQILMTAGIDDLVRHGRINPTPYLLRHLAGDWGDLSDHDQRPLPLPSSHPGACHRPARGCACPNSLEHHHVP